MKNYKSQRIEKFVLKPLNSKKGFLEGGLRVCSVFYKKSILDRPLISIITVCLNSEKYLEKTVKSIINQTYDNIEYIIIDGGSTDCTLQIIKKYEDKIAYWISEKDKGVYDAMNKGIDIATGEWINFMNAGDKFYKNNTVEKIFLGNDYDTDFIYGDCQIVYDQEFSRIQRAGQIKNFWKGMVFSHQSLFTKFDVFKKDRFNINNKIGADFEFLYNCYMSKYNFYNIHITVATVLAGGLSDTNRIESVLSHRSTVNKFSKNLKVNTYYLILFFDTFIRLGIKKILPHKIQHYLLKRKYK